MVFKMPPGQRKNPPSPPYPPTTHAVWEGASRRAGTVIRLVYFNPFHQSIMPHLSQKNALKGESAQVVYGRRNLKMVRVVIVLYLIFIAAAWAVRIARVTRVG